MKVFDKFIEEMSVDYDFEILYKNESFFMKFLLIVLFFNNGFMDKYITTIGSKVYYPSRKWIQDNELASIEALAHEMVHIRQGNDLGSITFSLSYLFPQCLGVLSLFSLLGFIWPGFLFCILFLLFALPFPAPFRKKFEHEGYVMSLYAYNISLEHKGFTPEQRAKRLRKFAGLIKSKIFRTSSYYFMWPLKLPISFEQAIKDIESGVISDTDEIYGRVQRAYTKAVSAYERL